MIKLWLMFPLLVSGCVTTSGSFMVTGTKADGSALPVAMAQGSSIYTMRNGICKAYPGATVKITDSATGKELASESPHQCR
ncbi:hypothetical protein LJR039_003173 [Pseudorhodoferax sp. LjRoot39]|uniref:hypothetical protein n=1 Tax=Pseudorhodoferax sp. LjRoot39 TaxID=3342328 RepID=UPI003ECEACE1